MTLSMTTQETPKASHCRDSFHDFDSLQPSKEKKHNKALLRARVKPWASVGLETSGNPGDIVAAVIAYYFTCASS